MNNKAITLQYSIQEQIDYLKQRGYEPRLWDVAQPNKHIHGSHYVAQPSVQKWLVKVEGKQRDISDVFAILLKEKLLQK